MGADNGIESYEQAFHDFKDYINKINSMDGERKLEGYLINLMNYKEFRQTIKNYKNINKENCHKIKIYLLKPENTINLLSHINNGQEFKIINETLFQKICDPKYKNYGIIYKISSEKIVINTENGIILEFNNNKKNIIKKDLFPSIQGNIKNNNIIKINSISNNKENNTNNNNINIKINSPNTHKNTKNNDINNNADKIYIDIINYYKIEKEITTKINNKNTQSEKYEGFLVDEYWFENWKKYSFYDFINIKYLEKNIEDKNTIISNIKKNKKKQI